MLSRQVPPTSSAALEDDEVGLAPPLQGDAHAEARRSPDPMIADAHLAGGAAGAAGAGWLSSVLVTDRLLGLGAGPALPAC